MDPGSHREKGSLFLAEAYYFANFLGVCDCF